MARTRSLEAHQRILRAALDLFAARGIEGASMDAISRAAGVSKATIYNHWADKEDLLMEVMVFVHGLDREREEVDTGDLCGDLTAVLCRRPPNDFDEERRRITPALIAYSAVHQEFGRAWRQRVTEPPRKSLRRIIERGIQCGQLPPGLDLDTSLALLLGPMLYVHIFSKDDPHNRPELGPKVAEAFCRAFAIRPLTTTQKAARR